MMNNENMLFDQYIFHGIKQDNLGGNMIIKLDMVKAYYRMLWNFLMTIMRKFDFSED